jgi:hypothetical protein
LSQVLVILDTDGTILNTFGDTDHMKPLLTITLLISASLAMSGCKPTVQVNATVVGKDSSGGSGGVSQQSSSSSSAQAVGGSGDSLAAKVANNISSLAGSGTDDIQAGAGTAQTASGTLIGGTTDTAGIFGLGAKSSSSSSDSSSSDSSSSDSSSSVSSVGGK